MWFAKVSAGRGGLQRLCSLQRGEEFGPVRPRTAYTSLPNRVFQGGYRWNESRIDWSGCGMVAC